MVTRNPGNACLIPHSSVQGFYLMVQFGCLSSNCHIHIPVGRKQGYTLSFERYFPDIVLTILTYMLLSGT